MSEHIGLGFLQQVGQRSTCAKVVVVFLEGCLRDFIRVWDVPLQFLYSQSDIQIDLRSLASGVLRPNSISVYPPPWYPFREMGGSINSDCVAGRIAPPPGARRGVYMARKPTGVANYVLWDYNI